MCLSLTIWPNSSDATRHYYLSPNWSDSWKHMTEILKAGNSKELDCIMKFQGNYRCFKKKTVWRKAHKFSTIQETEGNWGKVGTEEVGCPSWAPNVQYQMFCPDTYIQIYANMYFNEFMNLKESKEVYIGGFRERKENRNAVNI